ncbi:hypothetical protein [Canibacter zhoujuaniae]|uniref:hypothetical protein n=1 Tax=Canibacter zhoujuaniae TaxID=2708343 RepID=UPI0014214D42|nr:hypothetical protein [Canibacter zhoujuaniae]
MRHRAWKSLVGITTAYALSLGGTTSALATDTEHSLSAAKLTQTSDTILANTDDTLEEFDYADATAKALIKEEIGLSAKSLDYLVSDKVPLSLNLDSSNQSISGDILSGLSEQEARIINTLPTVDSETGEVSIPNPETREMFSIRVNGHIVTEVTNGVVRTQDADVQDTEIAVSHVTEDESGQIIGVIKDHNASYMDFGYTLPEGYQLEARSDGGFSLLSESGTVEGEIDAPWAIDADGKELPTSFELVDGSILRQHVNTEGASLPIVLDPSWSWWLVTAGKCAVSIAPLLVTGGAAIAARVPKLISFINKLSKTPKIATAITKVGGVKNAAVAAIKNAVITLRSKLPQGIASKLPSPTLTAKDKIFIAAAWPFIVDNFWDLIGIGSCYSLIRGR